MTDHYTCRKSIGMKHLAAVLLLVAWSLASVATGQVFTSPPMNDNVVTIQTGGVLTISIPNTTFNQQFRIQRTFPQDPSYKMVISNGGTLETSVTITSPGRQILSIQGVGNDFAYSFIVDALPNSRAPGGSPNLFGAEGHETDDPGATAYIVVTPALDGDNITYICAGANLYVQVMYPIDTHVYRLQQTYPATPTYQEITSTGATINFAPVTPTVTNTIWTVTDMSATALNISFNCLRSAQPIAPTMTKSPNTASACEGDMVSATILTNGSSPNPSFITLTDGYSYSYDGGVFNDYTPGTNIPTSGHTSVTVRAYRADNQGGGCFAFNDYTWTITPASYPATDITITDDYSCPGASHTLAVTGGTLGAGADWHWYTGSCTGTEIGTGSSIVVSPTVTTTYYVKAIGTCNTTSCYSEAVTVKPIPTLSGISANSPCPDAEVIISVTGLLPNIISTLTFTVTVDNSDNGGPLSVDVQADGSGNGTFSLGLYPTGLYICNVTEVSANSCSTTLSGVSTDFEVQPMPTVTFTATNPTCFGSSDGALTANVSGGTGYNYTWTATPPATIPTGQENLPTLTGIGPGTYNVTVNNSEGCSASNSTTLIYNPVLNFTKNIRYATIQEAINAADPGDIIDVCPGTFTENLSVTKSVNLRGANSGTAGCGTRSAESIIQGGSGTAVTIGANGVTIDGFAIVGATGISDAGFEGLIVENNLINTAAIGISVAGLSTTGTEGLDIHNNCIDLTSQMAGPNSTVGIMLHTISGTAAAIIDGNTITDGYYGYMVYGLTTNPKTYINGGALTGLMQGVAVLNIDPMTGQAFSASDLGITNIQMSGFAGNYPSLINTNFHAGVYVYTGGPVTTAVVTASIDNVTVDGTGNIANDCAGLSFADFSTGTGNRQNITVTACNIINNLNRGINVRGANALVDVGTSTLSLNGSAGIGTGGNDGFGLIVRVGASVNIHNCFITNPSSTTIPVTALLTDGGSIIAFNNSLNNNGNTAHGKLAVDGGSSTSITANCNWWGSSCSAGFASLISGPVVYDTWLTGNGDNGALVGFQPTALCLNTVITQATLVGPDTVCNNATVIYTTDAGMENYNWQVSEGGTVAPSGNTASITWNTSGTHTVSVSYTNTYGCNNVADPATLEVNVNPLPTATISGTAAICYQQSAQITITFTGTAPFKYRINGGPLTTATSNPQTITYTPSSNTTYQVTYVEDGTGCSNVGTGSARIFIGPITTATTVENVCANSDVDVPITVTSFEDVGAISLTLHYNPTDLHFVSYVPASGLMSDFIVTNAIIGGQGVIKIAGTAIWPDPAISFPGGAGTLVTLKFTKLNGNPDATLTWYDPVEDPAMCEYAAYYPDYIPFCDVPTNIYYLNGSVQGPSAVVVEAGQYGAICAGTSVTLAGSITGGGASTGAWTGGTGTFDPDRNTLNASYTPSAEEIIAGSVTLTLTSNNGSCTNNSDNTTITINPYPVISFGFNGVEAGHNAEFTYCTSTQINVSLYHVYAGTGPFEIDYTLDGTAFNAIVADPGEIFHSGYLEPGNHQIIVTDIVDDNGCHASAEFLSWCTATIHINALPVVNNVTLTASVGTVPGITPWPVGGSYPNFNMCIDPLVAAPSFYHMDINTLTSSIALKTGEMNGFKLNVETGNLPSNWFTYWSDKGVTASATTGWQAAMWPIINGVNPIFYIYYTGSDYQMIDGMTYQLTGDRVPLRVSGDYPEFNYAYYGTVTDVNGCVSLPFTVHTEFNTVPVPTITGLDEICSGLSADYTTEGGMGSYNWIVNGGTINGNSNGNTINITWGSGVTGTVSVNYIDPDGSCTAALPTEKQVTIKALPVPTINGSASVCAGSTVNYTTEAGMSGYTWSIDGGSGTSTTNSINVLWGAAGPGKVSVNYINEGGCTAVAATEKLITINALPVVSAASLQFNPSAAGPSWTAASGNLISGYSICMDPVTYQEDYYYLDINTLTSSIALQDGVLNPFFLTTGPSDPTWWNNKMAGWPQAWIDVMEDILGGSAPTFYIKKTGTDYQLIDGFSYLISNGTNQSVLKVDADYPVGTYTYLGHVTDINGCQSNNFNVIIAFSHNSTYGFSFVTPENICPGKEVTVPVTFATEVQGGCGYDGVQFAFSATGPGDVTFEASDPYGTYTFTNSGVWGPPSGFPLPASYTATTNWGLTFSAPGAYTITYSLVYAGTSNIVANITETVNATVRDLPVVSAAILQFNPLTAGPSWTAAGGSLGTEYTVCMDPVTYANQYYYLDINSFTSSYPVQDGTLNPFFLTSGPTGPEVTAWWNEKMTGWPSAWVTAMNSILAGTNPTFYIKRVGTDFQLIDGFSYLVFGNQDILKVDADYPAGDYHYNGYVTDIFGCQSANFNVNIEFSHNSTYDFTVEAPENICPGTQVTVPVTFETEVQGGCGYDGVQFAFSATGPGDVTFVASDPYGTYTFTNNGVWGPPSGFPLPALYTATTNWGLTFSAPGAYTITYSLVYAGTNNIVAGITETANVTVRELPEVTAATLQFNPLTAGPTWTAAGGALDESFSVCMDPVTYQGAYYYLDINTLVSTFDLEENVLNPFYLTNGPDNSVWWAEKMAGWPQSWIDVMNSILEGNSPTFYIKYVGGDYQLIDGFSYLISNGTNQSILKVDADYPVGVYHYSGNVKDIYGCQSDNFNVNIEFSHNSTYEFTVATLENICPDVEVTLPVIFSTVNEGGCGYEGVQYSVSASGPGSVNFSFGSNNFTNNGTWPVSGFSLPSSYSENLDMDITFDEPGDYTITYSLVYFGTNNVVANITKTISLHVNTLPVVDPVADVEVCNGSMTGEIVFSSNLEGTEFSWLNDDPSIGLGSSGNGDIDPFTAVNETDEPITANIQIYPLNSTCVGPVENFTITVYPTPVASAEVTTPISCNGGTGTVTITATVGESPFQFTLGTLSNSTGIFENVLAGNYSWSVTDAHSCTYQSVTQIPVSQPNPRTLSGTISYYKGANTPIPMNNVTVSLYKDGAFVQDAFTGTSNMFNFSNVCPGTYEVRMTTTGMTGGINATDAAVVNSWFINHNSNPIQLVKFYAGDVVGSNYEIIPADASEILRFFVNSGIPSWNNGRPAWTLWMNETPTTSLSNPASSFGPQVTIGTENVVKDYYALCTGDFNTSFNPISSKSILSNLELRYNGSVSPAAGQEFELPVFAGSNMELGAFSLILNYPSDKLEIMNVSLNNDQNSPLVYNVNGDEIRIGWQSNVALNVAQGEKLFTIKMKLRESISSDVLLTLAGSDLNELVDAGVNVIDGAILFTHSIMAPVGISDPKQYTLSFSNFPNPFTDKTNFVYSLPADGFVTIEIYNVVGAKINTLVNSVQTSGDHVVTLADNATPGVYLAVLKLNTGNQTFEKQIKIVRSQK